MILLYNTSINDLLSFDHVFFEWIDSIALVSREQLTPCHGNLTELTNNVAFFTVKHKVGLHADFFMLEGPTTLLARLEFALKFLMFFNRSQWDNLKTVRVVFTPNLCLFECQSKLWTVHRCMKLSLILSLLAFAALTPSLLPLNNARFAVNCVLAHRAVNRYIVLGHYDLLANDADNHFIQAKALEVLTIAYTVLCHQLRCPQ